MYFKYHSFSERTLELIKTPQIFVSSPLRFNDPFEGIFTIYFEKYKSMLEDQLMPENKCPIEALNHHVASKGHISDFKKNCIDKFKTYINLNYSVFCCSKICSTRLGSQNTGNLNRLMWAHYGDNHRGICIEYDFKEEREELRKVNYSENFYSGLDEEDLSNLSSMISSDKIDPKDVMLEVILEMIARKALQTKDILWKYENEYRMIFRKTESLQKICPTEIKSITIGAMASPETSLKIKQILSDERLKHIKFIQLSLDSTKYQLNSGTEKSNAILGLKGVGFLNNH